MDFFNFCWVFQKFPFFYVTLYVLCAHKSSSHTCHNSISEFLFLLSPIFFIRGQTQIHLSQKCDVSTSVILFIGPHYVTYLEAFTLTKFNKSFSHREPLLVVKMYHCFREKPHLDMTRHPVCPAYIPPRGWSLNGSQAKWVGEQPEDGCAWPCFLYDESHFCLSTGCCVWLGMCTPTPPSLLDILGCNHICIASFAMQSS